MMKKTFEKHSQTRTRRKKLTETLKTCWTYGIRNQFNRTDCRENIFMYQSKFGEDCKNRKREIDSNRKPEIKTQIIFDKMQTEFGTVMTAKFYLNAYQPDQSADYQLRSLVRVSKLTLAAFILIALTSFSSPKRLKLTFRFK